MVISFGGPLLLSMAGWPTLGVTSVMPTFQGLSGNILFIAGESGICSEVIYTSGQMGRRYGRGKTKNEGSAKVHLIYLAGLKWGKGIIVLISTNQGIRVERGLVEWRHKGQRNSRTKGSG